MQIPVNVDEFGAVYVVPKTGGALAGGIMVEVPDDFDFTKLHLYHLVDNQLIFDTQAAEAEAAEAAQELRESQQTQLKTINDVLTEALIRMLYAQSVDALLEALADLREEYEAILAERDGLIAALGGILDWKPAEMSAEGWQGYAQGTKVRHKGKVWESLVDNNTWEPGTTGTETVWQEVEIAA